MARSENGCGKLHFWSEIGSGFGEPGHTPPPRIARSIPQEMKPIFQVFSFFVFRQSLDDFWPHSRAPVKKIRKFDLKVWLVSLCIIKVIRSNLSKRPPFHNGHFSTTAMATKAWPQLPNNFWITASFFNEWWKSQETVRKLDPYGALMINRTKRILFVFHLYCCSKHKFSTILGANVASLFVYFILYIMWLDYQYEKH